MSYVSAETVHARLQELLEQKTKASFNHICKILSLPKLESQSDQERHERLSFAIEVFNRVPQGCLWRRTKDEVLQVAKAVSVKARGKAKGIEALQKWHKDVINGFVKAKETTAIIREGRALMAQKKPIPIKLLQGINQPNVNKLFEQEIYMAGDIAFDHAKGRDTVIHFNERSAEELAELELFGRIVETPLDTLFEQGLQNTSEFLVYKERAAEIVNYESATSLLTKEFDAVAKLITGIPKEILANDLSRPFVKSDGFRPHYLQRMRFNLYFAMYELNNSKKGYQSSLI